MMLKHIFEMGKTKTFGDIDIERKFWGQSSLQPLNSIFEGWQELRHADGYGLCEDAWQASSQMRMAI